MGAQKINLKFHKNCGNTGKSINEKKNQNRIVAIDNKRALWVNSWPFLAFSSVAEKTGRCREVISAVGDKC